MFAEAGGRCGVMLASAAAWEYNELWCDMFIELISAAEGEMG